MRISRSPDIIPLLERWRSASIISSYTMLADAGDGCGSFSLEFSDKSKMVIHSTGMSGEFTLIPSHEEISVIDRTIKSEAIEQVKVRQNPLKNPRMTRRTSASHSAEGTADNNG